MPRLETSQELLQEGASDFRNSAATFNILFKFLIPGDLPPHVLLPLHCVAPHFIVLWFLTSCVYSEVVSK